MTSGTMMMMMATATSTATMMMIGKSEETIMMSHYNLLPSKIVYCIFSVAL